MQLLDNEGLQEYTRLNGVDIDFMSGAEMASTLKRSLIST
jgi:hypothetical protein